MHTVPAPGDPKRLRSYGKGQNESYFFLMRTTTTKKII